MSAMRAALDRRAIRGWPAVHPMRQARPPEDLGAPEFGRLILAGLLVVFVLWLGVTIGAIAGIGPGWPAVGAISTGILYTLARLYRGR